MRLGRVFVDTGGWVALQDPSDRHHRSAAAALPAILLSGKSLATSNQVVGETYAYLRTIRGDAKARQFLDGIAATARLERLFVTEATGASCPARSPLWERQAPSTSTGNENAPRAVARGASGGGERRCLRCRSTA